MFLSCTQGKLGHDQFATKPLSELMLDFIAEMTLQGNIFENVVSNMTTILSWPQCVNAQQDFDAWIKILFFLSKRNI